MKRRRFIKNSIIGTLGIGLMPSRLLSSRNCNPTYSDILGKWVTTLVKENMKKGKHTITWRGDDMFGNLVASGSYLVLVKFGNSIQSRKIKLVK